MGWGEIERDYGLGCDGDTAFMLLARIFVFYVYIRGRAEPGVVAHVGSNPMLGIHQFSLRLRN